MEGHKHFNALISAVCDNNLETFAKLISSLKLSEAERFESFCLAVSHDLTEIVKLMLANGFEFVNKDTGECPAFQSAVFHNNIEIIQILLEKGVGIDPSLEKVVLYLATCQDNATVIRLLLDRGVDILAEVKGPFSCVHIAVEEECLSVLEFLLTNGGDVNTRYPSYSNTGDGDSLLHQAVIKGNELLVKVLFRFNIDVNVKSSNGATPLHIAVEKGFLDIADALVKAGAKICAKMVPDPDRDYFCEKFSENEAIRFFLNLEPPRIPDVVTSETGYLPLHTAVMNSRENMVKFLVERNADINAEDTDDNSVLRIAVEKANTAIIDLILMNYSPNVHAASNKEALNFAVNSNKDIHKEIAEKLLQYGFTVESENTDIFELLFDAVNNNHLKIVDDLLTEDADVNKDYSEEKDEDGKCIFIEPTLLHVALANNNKEMVEFLVNRGADVNAKPYGAQSPILYSIKKKNLEIVKFLLDKGASVKDDASILIAAVQDNLLEIIEDLLSNGADVNKTVEFDKESFNYSGYEPFKIPYYPVYYKKSALFIAAEKGYEKVVKLLVENGANLNFSTFYGIKPLLVAVINGHYETVDLLLKHGANLDPFDTYDSGGRTALHVAAETGHKDIVSLLIRYGAEVDCGARVMSDETPLFFSCKNGHLEVVDLLLKCGANIHAVDRLKQTPIFITAECGYHEMVKFLLDCGAELESEDSKGLTPLLVSAAAGYFKCVDTLLKCGANIHHTNEGRWTALHYASNYGHADIVKLLVKCGAKINAESSYQETPLSAATKEGHFDTVQFLLKSGASPNAGNLRPLSLASFNDHFEIVKLLLKYGARSDAVDKFNDDNNPLCDAATGNHINIVKTLMTAGVNIDVCTKACSIAAEKSHDEIVELLLDNCATLNPNTFFLKYVKKNNLKFIKALLQQGVSVNTTDNDGKTALHFAAEDGHLDIVKLLLDSGAKVDTKTKNDETPLHFSAAGGHLKVAEILLQNNASIDSVDCSNRTALFFAAKKGHNEMVKLLLELGANVNSAAESETNKTPLLIAAERGHFDIVLVLLQNGAKANVQDSDELTALYFAVEFGHEKAIEMLLEKGASINCQTRNGLPLILIAMERGHLPTVKILLKFGVNIRIFGIPALEKYCFTKVPKWRPQVFQSFLDFSYVSNDYGFTDCKDLGEFNIPPLYEIMNRVNINYLYGDNLLDYRERAKILVYHTVKMEAANLYAPEGNLSLTVFSGEDQIHEYRTRCEAEVMNLKLKYLDNTNVSLYSTLKAKSHALAGFVKNPTINEYISSVDLDSSFPIYSSLIKCQFEKGRVWKKLACPTVEILLSSSSVEKFASNGAIRHCVEEIVSYLCIEDLKSVSLAPYCNESVV